MLLSNLCAWEISLKFCIVMRNKPNSRVGPTTTYLVVHLCITNQFLAAVLHRQIKWHGNTITLQQHPSSPTTSPAGDPKPCPVMAKRAQARISAFTVALRPAGAWDRRPPATHAAYMCFTTWLLFIKPARGTGKRCLIQNASGRIMSMSHTLGKYSERAEWLLVFGAFFCYSRLLSEL